jgi:SecD/SecF fusion protein
MKSFSNKFTFIILLIAAFLWAWVGFGFTLGIDLQGGSVLIYKLDFSKMRAPNPGATTDSTIEILSRRLDTLAVKEMSIRRAGTDQILVQIPGASSELKEQIKTRIATAGDLWLKIVADPISAQMSQEEIQRNIQEVEEAKARGDYKVDEQRFDTARDSRDERRRVLLLNDAEVDGKLIEDAYPDRGRMMEPAVAFVMRPKGRSQLAKVSTDYAPRGGHKFQMAIVLDGKVISDPVLDEPLTTGHANIHGDFTEKYVEDLCTILKSGALPAKPMLVSENSIAATLGEASVKRGMLAVGLSLALIVVFMFIYYGWSGAIANVALVMNLILLMGCLALVEATLTLPGIAGIVLTLGMAVDANILINERMREERDKGLPLREVVREGYRHAFSAIFDGHVTAILTSIILYLVGTGPIRGFAVTLLIGVTISLFTAVWVTRVFCDWAIEHGHLKEVHYLRFLHGTNLPFVKKRIPLVVASMILYNVGFAFFALRGDDKYGIDFNGGSIVQMRLEHAMTTDEVHKRLAEFAVAGPEGKTLHPYERAEAQALGAKDAAGSYRRFEILLSSRGEEDSGMKAASAEERARASGAGATMTAETAPIAAETPQQRFLDDVAKIFAADLAPRALSEFKVQDEPGKPGFVRLSVDVRLDSEEMADPTIAKQLDLDALDRALDSKGVPGTVTRTGDVLALTTAPLDVTQKSREGYESAVKAAVESAIGRVVSNPFPLQTSIGSSVAHSLKARAVMAILLSLLMMIVYMAFRFEFKMGLATALCLANDVLVALGFMIVLDLTSKWTGIDAKLNLSSIAAFLTIVGYSINDSIITFDRMRENLIAIKPKDQGAYEVVLEKSINQTLARTVLTSWTVVMVLLVLAFAGVPSLMGFTLCLLVGVAVGTVARFSIATPILLVAPRRLAWIIAAQLALFIAIGFLGRFVHI